MRMLVVDDEVDIANMLAEYFRMEGYEVVCANSGTEALAAASTGVAPDIMLLDVNMPGMDGFEVCRRVREHLSCPIIFLTARIEDVDQLDFARPIAGRDVVPIGMSARSAVVPDVPSVVRLALVSARP